jgi:hypothetical protein
MKPKDIKLYALGSLLVVIALFGTIELSTRVGAALMAKNLYPTVLQELKKIKIETTFNSKKSG